MLESMFHSNYCWEDPGNEGILYLLTSDSKGHIYSSKILKISK